MRLSAGHLVGVVVAGKAKSTAEILSAISLCLIRTARCGTLLQVTGK